MIMRTNIVILAAVISILLAGCSASDRPDNLEPIIDMLPAFDITRTEAVVSAKIQRRGISPLSFVRLYYGESGSAYAKIEADNPNASSITVKLVDLKPGTSYSCYAECGTSTATLRSETITFTTIPNKRPSVSAAVPLATGPVGIIIGFDILDDGGAPITEAGCEIANMATGEKSRVNLSPDCLTPGHCRLSISALTVNTAYAITPFATNSVGETMGEVLYFTTENSVVIQEAGTLAEVLGNKVDLDCVTVSGEMNGSDFRYLRMLLGAPLTQGAPSLESAVVEANLTDVRIVEGGESYDGRRFTVDNELSTGLFSDCKRLRAIRLPNSATTMARDAFARCEALESLTVPAGIVSLLPSANCSALKVIEVSQANPNYSSIDGVLFNHDVTEILWFPLGKTGDYALPTSITAIGEYAFAGTTITSLVIPPSVIAIHRGAFSGSSLTEITLPDNLATVEEGLFQGCVSLTSARLGTGTEFIGNYVFDNTPLRDLYVEATIPPYVSPDAFVNGSSTITAGCTLHVPAGSKEVYRNHSRWQEFSKIEEL